MPNAESEVLIGFPQLSDKLEFIVPLERWHSANAGENGLPHQPEGWFAMTSFPVFPLSLRSGTLQWYVIATPVRTLAWQSVPRNAQHCVGRRPITLGAQISICRAAE